MSHRFSHFLFAQNSEARRANALDTVKSKAQKESEKLNKAHQTLEDRKVSLPPRRNPSEILGPRARPSLLCFPKLRRQPPQRAHRTCLVLEKAKPRG